MDGSCVSLLEVDGLGVGSAMTVDDRRPTDGSTFSLLKMDVLIVVAVYDENREETLKPRSEVSLNVYLLGWVLVQGDCHMPMNGHSQ